MLCLADDMVLSEKWRIIMEFKKLQSDMVAAMKARDKARKDTISSLISAVKKLAIDEGKRDNIPEELVDRAIIKEEKTAQEQVDSCPADREDLKAEYQARLDVIKEYAPKMMSPEEIEEVLKTQFAHFIYDLQFTIYNLAARCNAV